MKAGDCTIFKVTYSNHGFESGLPYMVKKSQYEQMASKSLLKTTPELIIQLMRLFRCFKKKDNTRDSIGRIDEEIRSNPQGFNQN